MRKKKSRLGLENNLFYQLPLQPFYSTYTGVVGKKKYQQDFRRCTRKKKLSLRASYFLKTKRVGQALGKNLVSGHMRYIINFGKLH